MRITSGKLKGQSLSTPKNSLIRPTTDKTRSAIFSTLFDEVLDARVIDCFAGTGGFGIEAVSRGAKHVTFIEKEPSVLNKNLKLLQKSEYSSIKGDFLKVCPRAGTDFDIVFIDPPYGKYTMKEILMVVLDKDILANDGILIYEESVRTEYAIPEEHFELTGEKRYGDTKIYYLRKIL